MVEEDLGEATITYEAPDGETVEKTVQNEHVAYFQDHWIVKTGEDDEGRDLVRRIPASRVYHVERTVEEFEREVETLRDQVQSVADDLRKRFLGEGGESDRTERTESISINVDSDDSVADDDERDET
ncbi:MULTISPECIES: hypothetical protein [Halorussus]|uniref:hypothetical protein n=1 Tax=Halorussus TaxID=1070314 RepID=UPI000E219818|nr:MULTISPECIES: hypothetical protein [Halorussus]NHN59502.1 hypothetical protein [Halorussus sp. JP-T4]